MIFQALDDNLDGVLDWSEFQEHSCSQLTPRIPVLGLVCRRCAMYFSSEAAACDRIGKKPRGGGGAIAPELWCSGFSSTSRNVMHR